MGLANITINMAHYTREMTSVNTEEEIIVQQHIP